MRPVVAVDLASRHSACVVLGRNGKLVEQFDSLHLGHSLLACRIWASFCQAATDAIGEDEIPLVVIEDLPPHVPSSAVKTSVSQLQGRILHQFASQNTAMLRYLYFVPPAYWERGAGVWKQPTDVWAARAAEAYGYRPPDLLAQRNLVPGTRGQATAVARALKQMTDYVAAFLLGKWAQQCMLEDQVWDMGVVKQYRE